MSGISDEDWRCFKETIAELNDLRSRNAKLIAALKWLQDYEPTVAAIMREKFDLDEAS